ncbi:MAG TPA: hypothetical protein VGJ75_02995 [Dongiaceae bacterium]|jgi:hypothetical protein
MIHFVTTRDHCYTLRHLADRLGRSRCRVHHYERLFQRKRLPTGTWIFTDHERLSAYELDLAARVAARLEKGGARILNHPARVLRRFDMLTALKRAGINRFSAWRAESFPSPHSFPVFIRNEYDHDAQHPALIPDQAALDARLADLQERGHSLVGKLVIEYAGEEICPGVWQRLQTYFIAGEVIAHTNVVDFHWQVKDAGELARVARHPGFESFLAHEQEFISKNLYADILRRAFELARIDYGRADFAIVAGRSQIYEINTNPNHADHEELFRGIHPRRAAIQKFSEDAVERALLATDRPSAGKIRMKDPMLRPQQTFARFLTQSIWRP